MKTKTLDVFCGDHINDACARAVALAASENCAVEFSFNDQLVTALPTDTSEELVKRWHDESDRRRAEYEASPEYKKSQEEWVRKEAAEQAALTEALAAAPETMSLKDPDGWAEAVKVNNDPYGAGVINYADKWARLMEARISNGESVAAVAKECSHLADADGITGFMYGCAVGILAQVWIHGEELRKWHNLDTQIGTEGEKANESGGILNPALLNIG